MTKAQRIGAIAGGVVAVVIAALLVAPEFVDWSGYRGEIASTIEARLGRPVAIDGGLDLSLLPSPHLVAERVRVGNVADAADPDFAMVERLELHVRTGSLLAGRFEVSSLTLVRPRFNLQRFADGRVNWRFAPPSPDSAGHGTTAASRVVVVDGTGGATLDRVDLQDAHIAFRSPRAGLVAIDGVNATATAETLDGPYQFHAAAQTGGLPVALQGSLGRLGDGDTPADISVTLGDGVARLSLAGVFSGRDAATSFAGKLIIKAPHADRAAARFGVAIRADGPIELRANVSATLHEFAAQALTLDAPGASMTGFFDLNMEGDPQLDIKLTTPRLDLAPWLPAFATAAKADNRGGAGPDASATAPAQAGMAQPGFALPAWLGASVDLDAESVVVPGTLLRAARLNAQLANGELTINQVGVTLPGGTQVNFFGFVDPVDGKPNFDGSFEAGTDDLRGLLRWLAIDVDAVPADRLGAARFTGHIVAAPNRIKLDGAEARVDGAHVTTAIDLRLPALPNGRPAVGANFAIDTLNADAYRPRRTGAAKSVAPSAPLSPAAAMSGTVPALAASFPLSGPVGRWLAGIDANLKGRIERLVAGGQTMRGVDLDAALEDGSLLLRSLAVADLDGAQLAVTGRVGDLGGPPRFDGLRVEAKSAAPDRLLTEAGLVAADGAPVGSLGALDFAAQVDGDTTRLALKAQAALGPMAAAIDGTLADPLSAPRLDMSIALSHPSLGGALRLVGQDYAGRAANQPVAASFHAIGTTAKLQLDDLRVALGPVAAGGSATLALTARPRVDVAITTGEVPLDLLLGATAAASQTLVRLTTPEPARQTQAPGEPAPPKAAPRQPVEVGGIPERFSHAPIDLSPLQSWDGTVKLQAAALAWGGFRVAQADLAVTLADGKATIDRLTGKLWGGDFAATAALDAGEDALSFGAKVSGARLDQAALSVADLDLADGTLDASADLTTTGQSLAEWMGRLAGSGRIAAHDGTLKGFDLKAADDRLRNPSAASLLTLVQAGGHGGQTKFSSLTGTIKASGGIFTTDDLTLTAEGGTLNANAAINLPAYAVDAHAALHLADAPGAPPLVMRLAGPLDGPRRVLDINPLQTWLTQRAAKDVKQ